MDSEPPFGEDRERERRRLERILPELVKRIVDLGIGKFSEGREDVKAFVTDMKLPREIGAVVAHQLEATKDALASSVTKEVRRFLDRTHLADELKQALSGMTLEVTTRVRFVPNDPAPPKTAPPSERDSAVPPADPPGETSENLHEGDMLGAQADRSR